MILQRYDFFFFFILSVQISMHGRLGGFVGAAHFPASVHRCGRSATGGRYPIWMSEGGVAMFMNQVSGQLLADTGKFYEYCVWVGGKRL